jgi:hypothetical protein
MPKSTVVVLLLREVAWWPPACERNDVSAADDAGVGDLRRVNDLEVGIGRTSPLFLCSSVLVYFNH